MKPIRALLWDLDGTLLDFVASERVGIRKTFANFQLGPCTDEMLSAYHDLNTKYWEKLERGECTKHETMVGRFVEFFAQYGLSADAEAFNDEYQLRLPETIFYEDGAMEVLQHFSGRVKQYCVTNGNLPVQKKKLRDSGMDRMFDGAFISDEVGYEKPAAAYFRIVLDTIALSPDEVLIIGDSLTSDMRGGNNAGIRCCWFNPKGLPTPETLRIDYTIKKLSELPALVDPLL